MFSCPKHGKSSRQHSSKSSCTQFCVRSGLVYILRLKVLTFCRFIFGSAGELLLPVCSKGQPAGHLHGHISSSSYLWAFHKGPKGRLGKAGCEWVHLGDRAGQGVGAGNVGSQRHEGLCNGFSLLNGTTCSWVWCTPRAVLWKARVKDWDSLGATSTSSEGSPLLPLQRLWKTPNLILAGMVRSSF